MDDPDRPPRSDPRRTPPEQAPPTGPEPETPLAEVRVADGEVQVTLPLPTVAAEDLRYYVGSNLVLVWSSREPEGTRALVHLPVDVDQGSSVVRFTNGVFDLTVLAASSSPPRRKK